MSRSLGLHMIHQLFYRYCLWRAVVTLSDKNACFFVKKRIRPTRNLVVVRKRQHDFFCLIAPVATKLTHLYYTWLFFSTKRPARSKTFAEFSWQIATLFPLHCN